MDEFEVLVRFVPLSPQCAPFDVFLPANQHSTVQGILQDARNYLQTQLANHYTLPRSRKEICDINDYEIVIAESFGD